MALSVCFRFMSLTVPMVSFVPLLQTKTDGNTSMKKEETNRTETLRYYKNKGEQT